MYFPENRRKAVIYHSKIKKNMDVGYLKDVDGFYFFIEGRRTNGLVKPYLCVVSASFTPIPNVCWYIQCFLAQNLSLFAFFVLWYLWSTEFSSLAYTILRFIDGGAGGGSWRGSWRRELEWGGGGDEGEAGGES